MTMRSSGKPHAVVLSVDRINGLHVARTLSGRGVPVIGIARDRLAPACRTKACERIVHSETMGDGVIATLEAVGRLLPSKAVLFPCEDLNVLPVSRHRRKLEQWYHIVLPDPDVVETLMHKSSLYMFAEREGLAIPRTFMLDDRSNAEHAARELTFPCILKPSPRSKRWEQQSSFKVYRASSGDELLSLYDRWAPLTERLVAQEWIDGPESELFTCYAYFGQDSEPLATFVTRKLRQWPPEMGEGCLGEECRNDEVLHETLRFFKSAAMRGFGYLEMKRDARTGRYLIVEPNIGRLTSKSSLAEACGVEFVFTMYSDALGWELPSRRVQEYRGAKWIFLRRDCQSAAHYWRKGELTPGEWLRSLRHVKVDAMFSWNDQAPFWHDLASGARRHLKRSLDRGHR